MTRLETITLNYTDSTTLIRCTRYSDKWRLYFYNGTEKFIQATADTKYELWDGEYKIAELRQKSFLEYTKPERFALYHTETGKDAQRKHKGQMITNKLYIEWEKTHELKWKDREW